MLPHPLASFVGREAERKRLGSSIRQHLLTTLVGPPGVGKTRLAVETARGLGGEYGERRWFVDLASVTVPDLVASSVLSSIDAPTRAGDAIGDVVRYLESEPALLVLDNCEHLQDGVAGVAVALLGRCEGLRILATSRSELGVDGEQVVGVAPLDTTMTPGREPDAVRLFYDRASARGAALRRDATEAGQVAGICERLDGLPLAIELAASRARVVSLADLDELLAAPLTALAAEPRLAVPAQRSLSESIEWSFRLCGDEERRALEALSVFAGPFTLAAAGHVLAAADILTAPVDLIDALVTQSLLHTAPDGPGRVRYRLLAVVRAFAQDGLLRSDDAGAAVREAHAAWYAEVGAALETTWIGAGQAEKLQAAEHDLSNIQAAASYALSHDRPEHLRGLMLLPAAELWWATGRLQEGVYWLRRIQAHPGLSPDLRFRTLMLGATFAYGLRLLDEGDRYLDEIARLFGHVEDPYLQGATAYAAGFGEIHHGDAERAVRTLSRCRLIADADPRLLRMSFRSRQLLVYAHNLRSDDDHASRVCGEIVDLSQQADDAYFRSFAHQMLAFYAWRRADGEAARRHSRLALADCQGFPNRPENIDLLIVCALLEDRWGDPRRAEVLLAAAGRADHTDLRPATTTARDVAEVVAAIASRTAGATRAAGASLTVREAILFAQGEAAPSAVPDGVALTPRETEVMGLIRDGMANKQIARSLGISPKTVEGHITRLMAKLGATSRVQIATWAP